MRQILNDSKTKFFNLNKSVEQVLIENCPLGDNVFSEICEAYNVSEDDAMEIMIDCKSGEFLRNETGWDFIPND